MLSERITAFVEGFAKYQDTGVELSPEGVMTIAILLQDFAADADDLERSLRFKRLIDRAAPAPLKLPENVVRLSVVR